MGLKENFSQAVKELTGNTKEDDKKRNAQVAGLKKALDNDPSFSANDRYTEETGRLYYRDEADQYNDRGDGYRQGNTRDGGRPISDSDGYRAGRDRYNDNTNRDYSRERNDGYRNRSDYREYADSRNGGYNDAPRRDDNYGVRNYDSQPTDGRNDNYDRSYDSGRQDRYGDYPYDDRGYNGQTYADDRGDVYTRQGSNAPDEERQNDVQGGYGGTATTAAKAHTAMLLKAVITTIRRKALTAAPTTADRAMVTTDVTIETSPAHPNVTIMCAASTTISSATTPAKGSSHRMVTAEDPHIPSAM